MNRDLEFSERKTRIDVSQCFLLYMTVIGDVEKTAAALDYDPAFVAWLAESEGWKEKVRRISVMSKGEKPGDWERAQNRALNFVQAHRVRTLIDRLLVNLLGMKSDELLDTFETRDRSGNSTGYSARFFADVMSALEKVHTLSYAALGDTAGERVKRAEGDDGEGSAGSIHAALIAALNNPAVSQKTSEALVLEAGEAISAALPERTQPEVEPCVSS